MYQQAGGGLLAAGLAFNSLFALLPAILLIIGLAGIVVSRPGQLASLTADLSERFPPLAVFLHDALSGMAVGAVTNSILGIVALVWGASRLYDSLDTAIARIFAGSRRRNPVERGVRGFVVVLGAIGLALAGFVGVAVATAIATADPAGAGLVSGLVTLVTESVVLDIAFFCAVAALVYRFVPTKRPSWRAIGRPAVFVGVVAAVVTQLFALIAPRLAGSLQVYGAFVALLATMIWLSLVCQDLLIGAAWVQTRGQSEGRAARQSAPGMAD